MALATGDIAFIGINSNGTDWLAFVALNNIVAGDVIYFTDNELTSATATTFNTGESYTKWVAPAGGVAAGTVIVFNSFDATTPVATTGTASAVSFSGSANRGLSATADVIYAYTATSDASVNTPVTHLAYINIGNAVDGVAPASLPANLQISFTDGRDGAFYQGERTGQISFANYLTSISNPANWSNPGATSTPSSALSTSAFTISSATPTVNLSVSSNTGTEAAQTIITVTATASAAVTGDQTVNLAVSGTGITAGDYTLNNSVITILNGQTIGSVTFTVVDDTEVEGNETAVLTLSNPSSGLSLGSTISQNIVITDNDAPAVPTVSIAATDATAEESSTIVNPGTFTVSRTGDTTAALTVTYTVGGTATNGTDYNNLSGSITIPAGQASATITVTPVNDANATEGNETINLTLVDGATYDLGTTASASVTIADNVRGALKQVGSATSAIGAEIPAFDPGSDRLFVVAGTTVEIYSVSSTGALTATGSLSPGFTPPAGTAAIPNSVTVKNGIVAVAFAVQNTTTNAQDLGRVSFFNAADGAFLNSVTVGYLPDMLTFTPDGFKVLTANEGEPNSYGQANSFDPEGSVSIIDLTNGVANATVQTAGFTAFNSQINSLKAAGVRITGPGSTVAQDLEPEYIAFSSDGSQAYVTLQENNALAIVDVATATVTAIQPLGTKNHNLPGNGIDPSDQDGGINIRTVPVFGLYQPDAIASYTVNGQTYYITANEGDSRAYTGFNEEIRVGAAGYVLDPTVFPNAATLKQNTNLGRLQVTNASGDTDGDGDFDRIEVYGARSFSIWDASGNQVFDSGDQLEQITAAQVPSFFNSDGSFSTPNFDTRSDNKGPEPEGVVIGVVNNRTYAFIGLERTGDVIVYEITNPTQPQFIEYINTPADIGVEGLTFVSAADSPTGKPLLITANEISRTVAAFEFTPQTRISDIQGAAHISPLVGQTVSGVTGIVTALASNGFYFQDPNPDADDRTSEAIFVFTSSAPTVTVGSTITVSGNVSEFRPGGNANNLTITQISAPTITTLSTGNALPTAVVLGNGGRTIPTTIIEDDATNVETGGTFDPAQDGIDFYESLEGMRVQINNPVSTSPTANFGTSEEIWVLADNGVNATNRTARGGSLVTATDFNPERIQLDDLVNSLVLPTVNVGAQLSTITGVVGYDFNNYEVLVSAAPTVVTPSPITKEVTNLVGTANQLTVATFNVENLDPGDGAAKFNALANAIVTNLKSPDILSLEEIQDNNGPTNDSVVDASVTFNTLIAAISAAGGPTYEYRQIDPVDDTNGGEPGGNIRVGFLFNPSRVTFVDRPGGTSTSNTTVSDIGNDGIPDLSASPGLIDPTNAAFNASRKPLVGEFVFNGQTVYVIGNHFNSKGGDQPLFGPNQPPTLSSEVQRTQQATLVRNFVQSILAINPNANVIVAGDLNDFEFSNPVNVLKSGGLNSLIETLPASERYTYNFQGNAQTLDHIMASNGLLSQLDAYDVVHMNSEFADQISDHDPGVARFNLVAGLTFATPTIDASGVSSSIFANLSQTTGTLVVNETIPLTYNLTGFTNVIGTAQIDSIAGNISNNILSGGSGDDILQGGAGEDSLNGGAGNDILDAVDGETDTLVGGSGDDLYAVASTTDIVNENFGEGTDTVIALANYTISNNIENLFLYNDAIFGTGNNSVNVLTGNSTKDSILYGEGGSDFLNGGSLNDFLFGGSGNDIMRGGGGDDFLFGDVGDDQLLGGAGNDLYVVDSTSDTIVENSGEGTDTVITTSNFTLSDNVENLYLYNGATVGTGNSLVNVVSGNAFVASLLDGGGGSDFLYGGDGNDTLIGGEGNDIITGAGGNDQFVFGGSGVDFSSIGVDTIVDFISGDQIILSLATFALSGTPGNPLSMGDFATVATDLEAQNSTALIAYNSSTGSLFYNQDRNSGSGFGTGGQFATLLRAPILTPTRFQIVG